MFHILKSDGDQRLVESCVFTPDKLTAMGIPEGTIPLGWWVGFYVDDDEAWEKIKNGTYTMFSIEGRGERDPVVKLAKTFQDIARNGKWPCSIHFYIAKGERNSCLRE